MATTLLKAKDLLEIIGDAESKKMDEERRKKEKRDHQMKELRDAFMSREIHPEVMDRLNKVIRIAAEQGLRQVEIITFPASYCNDRGRRINNQLPDWPESLVGFAKRAYDVYNKELRPLGYKLNAEVLNFAGEVPGDIGMTLKW